jgi:predicted nucleic acid-binding protein
VVNTATGATVADRIGVPDESLHAPHLLSIEVAHALRRLASTKAISAAEAAAALQDLADLDISRHDHEVLLPRVWELRHELSAYDAAYVALTEALGATLLTADKRLARSRGHRALVELLSTQ